MSLYMCKYILVWRFLSLCIRGTYVDCIRGLHSWIQGLFTNFLRGFRALFMEWDFMDLGAYEN